MYNLGSIKFVVSEKKAVIHFYIGSYIQLSFALAAILDFKLAQNQIC